MRRAVLPVLLLPLMCGGMEAVLVPFRLMGAIVFSLSLGGSVLCWRWRRLLRTMYRWLLRARGGAGMHRRSVDDRCARVATAGGVSCPMQLNSSVGTNDAGEYN